MKVLFIHNKYRFPGGEDSVYQSEMELLRDNRNEVFSYEVDNAQLSEFCLYTPIDRVFSCRNYHQILKIVKTNKPDIVHAHNLFYLLTPSVLYAAKSFNVPTVLTLHNFRLICPAASLTLSAKMCQKCVGKQFPYHAIINKCFKESYMYSFFLSSALSFYNLINTWEIAVDRYITFTESAKSIFIKGGIPSEKISIIPNFISSDKGLGKHEEDYYLFVGRISTEKGIYVLLEAWKHIQKTLVIIGDGPQFSISTKIGNKKNIIFLGHQQNDIVIQYMKNAKMLIFPSIVFEGCPLTIIEAFSCGLPVICSSIPSLVEMVKDKQTGLIFKTNDPSDLVNKVNYCENNKEIITKFINNARSEYEKFYSSDSHYQKLVSLYKSIIR